MTERAAWRPVRRLPGIAAGVGGIAGILYENDRYRGVAREYSKGPFGPRVHRTIRGVDGTARHGWRDFRRIENELVDPEAEAVELYPAESRLVDTASHDHLRVFREYRFPLGVRERAVSEGAPGVSQRPRPGPRE